MRQTIPPVEYNHKETGKHIATFDTETWGFKAGRVPQVFTCCFYDGETYTRFWGYDCIDQFFEWLSEQKTAYMIYVHNGGNFDFHFGMLDYLDADSHPFEVRGRIIRAMMCGQEFRDSYAIIPVPLAAYKKDEIDYGWFEPELIEEHKDEILSYQDLDCKYLHDLVIGFHRLFGDRLTMAGAALPMLNSFHGFDCMTLDVDAMLRPYFFGGRNQCFQTGEQRHRTGGKLRIYDRVSMYPTVMANYKHPISAIPIFKKRIGPKTAFAKVRATNYGALCYRHENGSLDFTVEHGIFHATIHEIRAGIQTGTLIIHEVLEAVDFRHWGTFEEFVRTHYALRLEAAADGDEVLKLFYKLLLNSSYGKLAIDPADFEDCYFTINGHSPPKDELRSPENPDGWHPQHIRGDSIFWSRPNSRRHRGYRNVATAASITGAARADLLIAIQGATNPLYCDTDSIACEDLVGVTFGDKELGAWKMEAEGDVMYIAAKKLYAFMNEGQEVKKASKGVRLTVEQIMAVALGETVEYANPVPKFHLDGSDPDWIVRNIKRTEKDLGIVLQAA